MWKTKGYKHVRVDDFKTKKDMMDVLMRKSLPYGKWITENPSGFNEEYLFNRDYEPIMGWDLGTNAPIPLVADMWIEGILHDKTEYYYNDATAPYYSGNVKTLRKCWVVLADWSERLKFKI